MHKCLHYHICKSYVDFFTGEGWVHVPSHQPYWMEHVRMGRRRLAGYNHGMTYKRGKGCGWKGAAPARALTITTDVCPRCGAIGELADNHVASPQYPKTRKKRERKTGIQRRFISQKSGSGRREGRCTASCTHAASNKGCCCFCGGINHGVAIGVMRLF